MHGEFPVKITIKFQHHYINHVCECSAEINGKTYDMNYNLAFAPVDRSMKQLEKILGGKQEIKRNAAAWDERTKNAPALNPKTQPVLFRIQKMIEAQELKKNNAKI